MIDFLEFLPKNWQQGMVIVPENMSQLFMNMNDLGESRWHTSRDHHITFKVNGRNMNQPSIHYIKAEFIETVSIVLFNSL